MSSENIETLRKSRVDGNRVLDKQFQTLNDIDNKTSKILRISLLFTGGFISLLSLSLNSVGYVTVESLNNIFIRFGALSMLASIIIASINYTESRISAGISGKALEEIADSKPSEKEHLAKYNRSISTWISKNNSTLRRNSLLATSTLVLTSLSVIFISMGFVRIFFQISDKQNLLFFSPVLALIASYVIIWIASEIWKSYNSWRLN